MNLGNQKERQAHDKRRKSDSPALWQTAEVASVCCANTPGVTRTPDRRFRNLPGDGCNIQCQKQLTASEVDGRSAGRSTPEDRTAEGGIGDADLAAIVDAWPTLPEPIRAAIRALVNTTHRMGG